MSKNGYSNISEKGRRMDPDDDPDDEPDDALPSYKPEKPQRKRVRFEPPTYEEAAEPNWTLVEHPPCPHLSESGCMMSAKSNLCCACMDERPMSESGLYSMYVDGEGWVERAKKWQFYCPSCQEYFDPEAKRKALRDQFMWAEARAQSLADERDRKYLGLGRWIHLCGEAVKACFPEPK
ncbi:hypothetical protein F4781DRAFT_428302 [Annulohypoxylon bovei var. microspora]|nr:hypothetical protein F4781DRAFT_428302 [Annulohypoxylon bovei var. microspora]